MTNTELMQRVVAVLESLYTYNHEFANYSDKFGIRRDAELFSERANVIGAAIDAVREIEF